MHVFLIAAISLDGFIAQHLDQPSTNWTSQEDKDHFHATTKQVGTIVMGKTTFSTIGFPLPKRLNIIYSNDSKQKLAEEYQLTAQQTSHDVLRVTRQEPAKLIKQLASEGVKQVAVCGGSSIYTQFMQSGLVDKVLLTIEPVIFGNGIKLFNHSIEQRLKLIRSKKLNQQGSLLVEYTV